ncbi:hypothetical protein DBB33_13840 [Chromobacterium haemolyticum]|uniref:Uncharacterized protein n=1 Tax=Chromobacterium rhizoryzae TaxID=1778675 RepID=A0AAD0RPG6_9NEIS|nr:hypothetical protein D1345_08435 [Chromobacterium rhizoryzae]OQS40350.1 hypothetical protein B0T40_00855 [Chromobacterium haemolyticum]PTU70451.1 hypothetical protein DBB33_13840 [Chromobacterium haemolyticum]BBH12644.1 hypothetical protein CH06BL_18920 [Chromobacterium haemolyticum]
MMANPVDVSASPSGGLISGGALARSGPDGARAGVLSLARLFFLAANLAAERLARGRFAAAIPQPAPAGAS